jgi:sialate O-acetylesterase
MGDLGLSVLVSDSMVIQRDAAFPVWSRKKLLVTFLGKTYESRNADGKWLITLNPSPAGGPYTMNIVSDNESVSIKDIYIGDLWLCAGQSNMELMMQRLRDNYSEEWEIDNYPPVRNFKAIQEWVFSSPREELSGGVWRIASRETIEEFSGTAWFFAKKTFEKHGVPIGLVNTAWGGTPVESWMSREALADFSAKIAEGSQYGDPEKRACISEETAGAINEWETNLAHEDLGLPKDWKNPETDISAWDEMTLPGDFSAAGLTQFCGVIWLAKDFEVSASFSSHNAKVWLGTIVDSDTVFINGTEIGNTGYRYPPRKYPVKQGLLHSGKNRIVIRVTCNSGEGGVTRDKPFRIFTDNETVELEGKWKYKIGVTAQTRPAEFFFQRLPMGNYNAMIAPLLKFPFRGVIWYQGESNDPNPREYSSLFISMIKDWRKKNNNAQLPFLFVQLPIFGEPQDNDANSSWAIIREAQESALSLPATGIAAGLDLGEWNDLHPLNKKDVGHRLFLAAEKTLFKNENSSPGPTVRGFEKRNEKLFVFFDNCAKGLCTAKGLCAEQQPYVSVIGEKTQTRTLAQIEESDTISIDLSAVENAKKVLYAWANNPCDRQLFNSEGLPALPFKIEL